MIAGLADTHPALWYLLNNPLLSVKARRFIEDTATAGNAIALSPISLAEIIYPFGADIVEAMRQVPRAAVPDMPDRIVAATAV